MWCTPTSKGISAEVWKFFFDLSGAKILVPHSLWTVKNDCGTPTHQTRQQWTAKDVEKNRVSFKIITQNNKNVIFIGFDGQFDLKRPQKSKKKHWELTHFLFANYCTECKCWVVTFWPTVRMGMVRLPCFFNCVQRIEKYSTTSSKMIKKWNWWSFFHFTQFQTLETGPRSPHWVHHWSLCWFGQVLITYPGYRLHRYPLLTRTGVPV